MYLRGSKIAGGNCKTLLPGTLYGTSPTQDCPTRWPVLSQTMETERTEGCRDGATHSPCGRSPSLAGSAPPAGLHPNHTRRFLLSFTTASCLPAPSRAVAQPTAAPKHTAGFPAALPSAKIRFNGFRGKVRFRHVPARSRTNVSDLQLRTLNSWDDTCSRALKIGPRWERAFPQTTWTSPTPLQVLLGQRPQGHPPGVPERSYRGPQQPAP